MQGWDSVEIGMISEVIAVPFTASVKDVAKLMTLHAVSYVIVQRHFVIATDSPLTPPRIKLSQIPNPCGILTNKILIKALASGQENALAQEVMIFPSSSLHLNDALWSAYPEVQQEKVLPVCDFQGKWVGLVTPESFLQGLNLSDPSGRYGVQLNNSLNLSCEDCQQVAFGNLVSYISTSFLSLSPQDFSKGIQDALQKISEFVGIDRSYVAFLRKDQQKVENVYSWCYPGLTPLQVELDEVFQWLMQSPKNSQVIYCPTVKDFPSAISCDPQLLEAWGIKSLLIVPILSDEDLVGWLRFDAIQKKRYWKTVDITLLKLIGEIFVNARSRIRYQEELEASNADLEQFAYVISHDLREPLSLVTNYAKLLQKRYANQLNPKGDRFIHHILTNALQIQTLLEDWLTYLRLGKKRRKFQEVDCQVILERAIANLHHTIAESQAQILYSPLPSILGDPRQLVQLFQNLIHNALKYRGQEVPVIKIHAELTNNKWLFSVHDNGIGIDPLHSERIFELFQRLHTSEEYPGTGIGLAICSKIIQRHGGRIWVDSEVGKGATFYFTLG